MGSIKKVPRLLRNIISDFGICNLNRGIWKLEFGSWILEF